MLQTYQQATKRNFILDQLTARGISKIDNKSIHELDYPTLKRVLVMSKVKEG
ncbi:hypothetical protein [Heyndrickxia ginsengihumi]|uniref:hypothetical protein n=1 Tax=Heyndrickxia ginsengihumi TaxID=363870 RepID=UPI0004B9B10E|nr:hypothetical protein [Heyndrickxia ginsengihumi]